MATDDFGQKEGVMKKMFAGFGSVQNLSHICIVELLFMNSRNEIFINDMNCSHAISPTSFAAWTYRFNNLNHKA